ncbi:MAG: hypothetical protein ACRYF0_05410 [Janthinobacterium lividum]
MADQAPQYPGILDQELYDRYNAKWVEVINRRDPQELQDIFEENSLQLTGLGFSIEQIAKLVGTIGAVHIKARFLVQPTKSASGEETTQFSIALFATDSLNSRISSYYVPEKLYTDTASFQAPKRPGQLTVHKNQLHHVLAERWRKNWTDLAALPPTDGEPATPPADDLLHIKPEYFDTHYGPMRGYTYEINEFVALFLLLETLDDNWLKVYFVLHDYYQPDPLTSGDQLAQTFALALQVQRSGSSTSAAFNTVDNPSSSFDDIDDPILDNGMPCPPTC